MESEPGLGELLDAILDALAHGHVVVSHPAVGFLDVAVVIVGQL